MSLQTLIHKIEGLLAVIEDDALSRELEDLLFVLENVNAHTFIADYDFKAQGKSTVDKAVKEIIDRAGSYSRAKFEKFKQRDQSNWHPATGGT